MAESDGGQRRRRLEGARPEDKSGRSGCIITGAVLGVIVGLTFAFYGLPPILRSIYGEDVVSAGETYRGDAKVISVLVVEREDDLYLVTLSVRSGKTFAPVPSDWQLEVATREEWIEALPPDADLPETSLDFELGRERTLLLRFPAPSRLDAVPEALHLASPRVRFELETENE